MRDGTPVPEPRSPSAASDDGKDEDWVPGQRSHAKKRYRKCPPGSAPISAPKAAATGASASAVREGKGSPAKRRATDDAKGSKRGKKKEQALVEWPSLMEVANVKAPQAAAPARAAANGTPDTVDAPTLARRKAPVSRRDEQAPADMVGLWSYGENLSYEINMFYEKLFYQEFNTDGSPYCQGELVSDGKYWIAILRSGRILKGTIRLLHEAQVLTSNFKDVGSAEWQSDTVARKHQATPVVSSRPSSAAEPLVEASPVVASRPSSAAEPLLEGSLGLKHSGASLPGHRYFVLHRDHLHCYKNLQAVRDGAQPLESFCTDQLQDLKNGSEKRSVAGESVKIYFMDAGDGKMLVASARKARSTPASTGSPNPATAARVKSASVVKSKAKAKKAMKRAW